MINAVITIACANPHAFFDMPAVDTHIRSGTCCHMLRTLLLRRQHSYTAHAQQKTQANQKQPFHLYSPFENLSYVLLYHTFHHEQ